MKLNKVWAPEAWEDYVDWKTQDKKTLKRINALVKDIERNGCAQGIGKPEQLRGDLSGWCLAVLTARAGLHIESVAWTLKSLNVSHITAIAE